MSSGNRLHRWERVYLYTFLINNVFSAKCCKTSVPSVPSVPAAQIKRLGNRSRHRCLPSWEHCGTDKIQQKTNPKMMFSRGVYRKKCSHAFPCVIQSFFVKNHKTVSQFATPAKIF